MNKLTRKSTLYFFAALACSITSGLYSDELPYNQEEVRTAFLYRSLQYVKWNNFLDESDTSLVICSNASPPVSNLLRSLSDRKVSERKLKIIIKNNLSMSDKCNVVYIKSQSVSHFRQLVELFQGHPVLTVNDNSNYINQGAILNFILKDNYITIEVNLDQAEKNNITFSAKFLRIAKLIGNRN